MNVLIDTNIVLDFLQDRAGFADNAQKIFRLCETGQIDGYLSALSVPNIVYIMRKELDSEKIKACLEILSLTFTIADLKADDLKKAANLDFSDFEDALQSVCAVRNKVDYIVTRNIKDFAKSKVPAILPSEFLELL